MSARTPSPDAQALTRGGRKSSFPGGVGKSGLPRLESHEEIQDSSNSFDVRKAEPNVGPDVDE